MRSMGREVAQFLRHVRGVRDLVAVLLLVGTIAVWLFAFGWGGRYGLGGDRPRGGARRCCVVRPRRAALVPPRRSPSRRAAGADLALPPTGRGRHRGPALLVVSGHASPG